MKKKCWKILMNEAKKTWKFFSHGNFYGPRKKNVKCELKTPKMMQKNFKKIYENKWMQAQEFYLLSLLWNGQIVNKIFCFKNFKKKLKSVKKWKILTKKKKQVKNLGEN